VYRAGVQDMISLFNAASSTQDAWVWSDTFCLAAGSVFVVLILGTLLLGYRRTGTGERTAWAIDAGETLLLALYFAMVPPLLAIGLYFCLWHAPRHIARLLLECQATTGTGHRSFRAAMIRFARDATPTTLAALVLLGGLYIVVPSRPDSLPTLVALYLALVAALTLPHTLIVTWMDVRQGVWRR